MKKILFIISSFLFVSCFTEPKKEVTEVETSVVNKEPEIEYDNSQVVDSAPSYNENIEPINHIQSITLFSDVSGIYPKKSSLQDIKLILGEPDYIDITKLEFDKYSNEYTGGNKIVKYKKLGIELLFEKDDIHMSAVDNISISKNFNVKSSEGIYIGMPEEKCLKILDSKYFKDFEIEDYRSYTKKEGNNTNEISVLFKDGKLDKLTMY